ncbi:unannotated protein [freshwater metagenome]|uniref:Unannotated protein n=1 Tax=freshwater metagenome TaxID=449393 RepID=A0A6J6TFM8_9ZZZZ
MRDGLEVQLELAVQVPVTSLEPINGASESLVHLILGEPSDAFEHALGTRRPGQVQLIARNEDAAHHPVGARNEVHLGAVHERHRRDRRRCEAD